MVQSTAQLAVTNKANIDLGCSEIETLKATEVENLGATLSTQISMPSS